MAALHTPPAIGPFTARVLRDDVDGVWVAECVQLPGCMSQGETPNEALEHLADAIGGVLTVRMRRHIRDTPRLDIENETDRTVELAV